MEYQNILSKTFLWLFMGLFITFMTGYVISLNEEFVYNMFSSGLVSLFVIAEVIMVLVLTVRIRKMSYIGAIIGFVLYSALSGVTFSLVLANYQLDSIILVFGLTALLFAVFGVIGYFTKIDLSRFGVPLFMGLIGIIIAAFVGLLFNSPIYDIVYVIFGLIIFMGYVTYDMNKIKRNMLMIDDPNKLAIYVALELYLDFINIFIRLLRLFGKAKD